MRSQTSCSCLLPAKHQINQMPCLEADTE
jgi:hypothetical protein